MSKLIKTFNTFVSDESGQGITEYAAMLGFVALLLVAVYVIWSGKVMPAIEGMFTFISNQLNSLSGAGGGG